jgi:hypothetical protein
MSTTYLRKAGNTLEAMLQVKEDESLSLVAKGIYFTHDQLPSDPAQAGEELFNRHVEMNDPMELRFAVEQLFSAGYYR